MSLIKCGECGANISEYAESCPMCGCPMTIIKENTSYKQHILTIGSETIDLTGIENELKENQLNSTTDVFRALKKYGASGVFTITLMSIFEFNNYKFPTNYQETYDAMCAQNSARVNRNTPKCPTCKSTRIQKIGSLERGASIIGFGLFSKKLNKTFKCNNCGYMW